MNQVNVQIAPVATVMKIKINDTKYPQFQEFKVTTDKLFMIWTKN